MQESNLRQLESKSSALPAELIHNGKTIPLSQALSRRRTTRDRNALPKALVERGSAEHGTAGTTCTTAPTGMPVGGLELKGLYCWGRKAKRPGDPCGASEPFSLTVWSAGRYSYRLGVAPSDVLRNVSLVATDGLMDGMRMRTARSQLTREQHQAECCAPCRLLFLNQCIHDVILMLVMFSSLSISESMHSYMPKLKNQASMAKLFAFGANNFLQEVLFASDANNFESGAV
jgi:hypothetical protein